MMQRDQYFMALALDQARQAEAMGEVPVGAVLVRDDEVLATGFNQLISRSDPSAHAEINALRSAAKTQNNYRLPGTTLYVTLEPCTMCVGAIIHARVADLVFAAREPRAGAVCSTAQLLDATHYNHHVRYREGVMAKQSADLLRAFFQKRRRQEC